MHNDYEGIDVHFEYDGYIVRFSTALGNKKELFIQGYENLVELVCSEEDYYRYCEGRMTDDEIFEQADAFFEDLTDYYCETLPTIGKECW